MQLVEQGKLESRHRRQSLPGLFDSGRRDGKPITLRNIMTQHGPGFEERLTGLIGRCW